MQHLLLCDRRSIGFWGSGNQLLLGVASHEAHLLPQAIININTFKFVLTSGSVLKITKSQLKKKPKAYIKEDEIFVF